MLQAARTLSVPNDVLHFYVLSTDCLKFLFLYRQLRLRNKTPASSSTLPSLLVANAAVLSQSSIIIIIILFEVVESSY